MGPSPVSVQWVWKTSPITRWLELVRFCVMREGRKRANVSRAEGPSNEEFRDVDFSLQSVRSRPAKVGDKLVARRFGTGTRGFADADDPGLAVCVMPGTDGLRWRCCVPADRPARLRTQRSTTRRPFFDRSTRTSCRASRCARISGWADRVADAAVRGSVGNGAATACAANDRAEEDAQTRVTYVG